MAAKRISKALPGKGLGEDRVDSKWREQHVTRSGGPERAHLLSPPGASSVLLRPDLSGKAVRQSGTRPC